MSGRLFCCIDASSRGLAAAPVRIRLYLWNANHYHFSMPDADELAAIPPRETPPESAVKRTTSEKPFGAAREIEIEHAGRVYRMRITHSGKLILTA